MERRRFKGAAWKRYQQLTRIPQNGGNEAVLVEKELVLDASTQIVTEMNGEREATHKTAYVLIMRVENRRSN